MYLRTVQRRNRDGSVVRYVQLAHNFRHPQTGRPQAQVLWSFGREEEVDRAQLERLVRSIERFLSPEQALQRQARDHEVPLRFLESRPLGGGWVLDALWRELGIPQAIGEVVQDRRVRLPVERALFALVANRALAPTSKLGTYEWLKEEVALPGTEGVELHHLYRAMDLLVEAGEPLQRAVYFSVANLLQLEVDLLFLDTTTTYFEVEEEAGLRRRSGRSTDRRPDLPQIVIGLAVTRSGLPVRCWVWPGNTTDVTRVEEVKQDLVAWKLGRVVTVVDRGFVSEENLRVLRRAGGHYIAGERLRAGKKGVKEALSRPGRYQQVGPHLEVKEIVVGTGEARQRYILVRNAAQAERDREQREQILGHIREELEAIERLPPGRQAQAVGVLLAHPTYGRYLKLDQRRYLPSAGRPHPGPRPAVLAGVAQRVEQGLGQPYSWDRIRIELQRMHLGTFRGQAGVTSVPRSLPSRPSSSGPSAPQSHPASSASTPPGPRGVDTRVCLPSMPEKPVIAGPWPLPCRSQLSNSGC
jgi:hypothetical protein